MGGVVCTVAAINLRASSLLTRLRARGTLERSANGSEVIWTMTLTSPELSTGSPGGLHRLPLPAASRQLPALGGKADRGRAGIS